jgi:hypothetical protein
MACRLVVPGGFPQEKEAVAEEFGGQPHEVQQILSFSLSKGSPAAYSTYRNVILSLLYFICM